VHRVVQKLAKENRMSETCLVERERHWHMIISHDPVRACESSEGVVRGMLEEG
jgi:hypothetical protein